MKLADRLYGEYEIAETVLPKLMETAAMQRLHGVLQHGITGLIGITVPVSRYEHSIGVMLLVRRLGGPLEEQIAALLHDVSHTAFSHVIDYVFDGHQTQSYHEEHKEPFLRASDVPAALSRFGYDWREFLHEEDFPLLEQPAPALCADRLDYFLRDSLDLGLASMREIQTALDHLAVAGGRIVVRDAGVARWMGETFIAADDASWANFREVALYELTAQAIRRALEKGILQLEDLWTTDREVWGKLQAAGDTQVQALLKAISPQTQFVRDAARPDFRVGTKLRTIDPPVLMDGRVAPLSEIDPAFGRLRSEYLTRKAGSWPVRVVR